MTVLIFQALVRISAGMIVFADLAITPTELIIFFAAWVILSGIAEIVVATALSKEMNGEWPLPAAGSLSIIFGALLLLLANEEILAIVMGSYAIIFGLALMTLSLRLRQLAGEIFVAAASTSQLNHSRSAEASKTSSSRA
jgi:uncharacterized membrane protein HdeD (DUF308 family)